MSLVLTVTYFLYFNSYNLILWYVFDICEMRDNHISWEQNNSDQLGRVLTANSPVGKTFIFWHRKCNSYEWKRKKNTHTLKFLQNKNSFYIKKQGESQEIQGHQNYRKKQDLFSHFLINKPESSLKV